MKSSKTKTKSKKLTAKEISAKAERLREIKREAATRFRARAKAIAEGKELTPDIAIRTLQPSARRLENFKVMVGNKHVKLQKSGADKVALVTTENVKGTTVRTRKTFKELAMAVKAFNNVAQA